MNHNFIRYEIPNYLKVEFMVIEDRSCYKKCKNCLLEVFNMMDGYADYMYINEKEVFHDYYNINYVPYSCEDIIIKNIIE